MAQGTLNAAQIRALLEAEDPALLTTMDALRDRFGARLTALRVGDALDIGWDKWLNARAHAVDAQAFPRNHDEGPREWKRIKAEALKAGDSARRRPTARQPWLVR